MRYSHKITTMTSLTSREQRTVFGKSHRFHGCTVWLTGYSGAGKSTIAYALEHQLVKLGYTAYVLDGDNIRSGLNKNLGFTDEDRIENIRRLGEVAKLFADANTICITSFISPFIKDRDSARLLHQTANLPFFEVHVSTPLDVCEQRDVKGLYKRARSGQLPNFTGISAVYEQPTNAELMLKADKYSVAECVQQCIEMLTKAKIITCDLDDVMSSYQTPFELFITDPNEVAKLRSEALTNNKMHKISLTKIDLQWIQVLAEGWATPLRGFMRESEYLQVLYFGQLKSNDLMSTNFSIPIVLAVTDADKASCINNKLALWYENKLIAVLLNCEFYPHRKEERCAHIFGLNHLNHPTINLIHQSGNWLVGGDLKVFDRIYWDDGLDAYRLTPAEIRQKSIEMKADCMFAFQLRNPIHNGHALLMTETKRQLSTEYGYKNPLLLLHPLGGWTKPDDVPLDVRIAQHVACLNEGVLDKSNTLLAIFPSPMLYAGPREVQWHARTRLVAGANFYIVGRDPAGLQHPDGSGTDLYDPRHGAMVLSMAPGLQGLKIIPFRVAAYDQVNKQMTFFDPKMADNFLFISGTKMRNLAKSGTQPPDGFMAPTAWQILANYYKGLNN